MELSLAEMGSAAVTVEVAAVYADGGIVGRNPSKVGGTWAYCRCDAVGVRLDWRAGSVTPEEAGRAEVTNNFTELLAAVLALEGLPDGWAGTLYTDSQITAYRVGRERSKFAGIPEPLVARVAAVRARLGRYRVVLLGGHPSYAELAAGKRRDGLPCSWHNVFCDKQASRAGDHLRRMR